MSYHFCIDPFYLIREYNGIRIVFIASKTHEQDIKFT